MAARPSTTLYKQHDAFWSTTRRLTAGVDIYALALWRDYGSTPRMRQRGGEMEAGIVALRGRLYNANLRNISGPYDRAYGMDMQSYVSVMGLWLRTVLDADHAPLTTFDPPVDHVADLWIVPLIVVLDTKIPPDAMAKFEHFPGPHQVNRPIADQRIATAWIGKNVIYGGEITGHTRDVDARSQFHPVTVQWQAPGWQSWVDSTHALPADRCIGRQVGHYNYRGRRRELSSQRAGPRIGHRKQRAMELARADGPGEIGCEEFCGRTARAICRCGIQGHYADDLDCCAFRRMKMRRCDARRAANSRLTSHPPRHRRNLKAPCPDGSTGALPRVAAAW